MEFSRREVRDLLVAWVVLGVAFTLFLNRQVRRFLLGQADVSPTAVLELFVLSLLTVGVGFLLHELAHKFVAVRFGQVAEFRADYGMLFLAVVGALVGFLFAAPGAVHHRGRGPPSAKENGLIAVAGPVTNLGLAALFLGILFAGSVAGASEFVVRAGSLGLTINLLLAAFNMIPYGPLDGKTVLSWNKLAYAVVAVPSIGLGLLVFFT